MPVQKRATNLPQSAEPPDWLTDLPNLFPCPAWIEDSSGRILARNNHVSHWERGHLARELCGNANLLIGSLGRRFAPSASRETGGPNRGQDARAPSGDFRLVAQFPARQVAQLAKTLQFRQAATVDEALLARFTPRQRDIWREYSLDFCFKEIAARLGIAHSTVLVQVHRMRKISGADMLPYQRKKRGGRVN